MDLAIVSGHNVICPPISIRVFPEKLMGNSLRRDCYQLKLLANASTSSMHKSNVIRPRSNVWPRRY
jgi:hypothetical protein